MNDDDALSDPTGTGRFRPATPRTQEEVGGVLERAFQHESGREPNEEEVRRFLAQAVEAEQRAEAAEASAREAEAAGREAADRYARSGDSADVEQARRWEEAAAIHRREALALRSEAERLRQYQGSSS